LEAYKKVAKSTVGISGALRLLEMKGLDTRFEWNKGRRPVEQITPGLVEVSQRKSTKKTIRGREGLEVPFAERENTIFARLELSKRVFTIKEHTQVQRGQAGGIAFEKGARRVDSKAVKCRGTSLCNHSVILFR